MTTINWEAFVIERLRSYDPNIDTTTGSAAWLSVINPIVRRLTPDPLEMSPDRFVLTRLQQEHPELFFRDGGILNDVLVGVSSTIVDAVKREIQEVQNSQKLDDPTIVTTSDVDARLENLFFTRDQGAYATVRVRAYFVNPVSVVIGSGNVAYTSRSLRYIPISPLRFSSTAVLLNKDDETGYYYVDVTFRAERPGAAYNVGVGEIIGITGITAAIDVTNLYAASPGRDAQTNAEFIEAAKAGIGERSLNTLAGISAVIPGREFPAVDIIQVIGFNDPEMGRDVITGGSLGDILHNGEDASTSDDGDSDGYTPYLSFTSFDVTANFGPVGTDVSDYTVTLFLPTGPVDFVLGAVQGQYQVSISEDYEGEDRLPHSGLTGAMLWTIRQGNVIELSDIPGGILFPSSEGDTVEVPAGSVHVGSCTDIYLRGPERETKALTATLVADEEAIKLGEQATTVLDSDTVTLNDVTATEWDDVVVNRTCLYLETGPAGAYRIIEKLSGTPYRVRVHTTMGSSASNISYVLVDDVDINLASPKEIRWRGLDLRTVAGIPAVETTSGSPDFVAIGVLDTDTLRIINGDDAGEYDILSGGVSSSAITLAIAPANTSSPLQFEIYRKQDGIDLPLVRVTDVELLDGDLEPTGDKIPYRHPVDVQSRAFQNPGRGARAGTDESLTNDTLEYISAMVVRSSDSALDFYAQGLRAGNILNINSSDNQGYHVISAVGGAPGAGIADNELQLESEIKWNVSGMEYAAGPPSYGSFRLYFLSPVTFEAIGTTQISVDDNGTVRTFRPDPELFDQFLPTSATVPTIVFSASSATVSTYVPGGTTLDPILHDIQVGDRVRITYGPIVGAVNLSSTAPGVGPVDLDGQTILIDVGNGTERVFFDGTSLSADDIVDQINEQLTVAVAQKWEDPAIASSEFIMLRSDRTISLLDNSGDPSYTDATGSVFGSGASDRATYQPWLTGSFDGNDTANTSPDGTRGYYAVTAVTSSSITLKEWPDTAWTGPSGGHTITKVGLGHYIRVERPGRQRISSTDMVSNVDEHGLYYFDLECVSVGHGDPWNISSDLQGVITEYYSEGWSLRTDDSDTSFSMAEIPWLDISARFLPEGDSYDLANKVEAVGSSIQVTYERDDTVEQVHEYVRDQTARVTCNNPLVRSLLPVFVRVTINYARGGTEAEMLTDVEALIKAILPDDELEVSDIEALFTRSGATSITHPITLIGISHLRDRSLLVERSVDAISSSRLFGLLPDSNEDGSLVTLSRAV